MTNRIPAKTFKGFRDFLPEEMMVRNYIISNLKQVFQSYGFSELQTPTLEYAELLLGKYGQEAEQLMYLFTDRGKRQVGLRYDLTVPLARVITQYKNLPMPFKRYQIQPAFRAENPQQGRYREFVQCDIDIVGSQSPLADAEILAVINTALTTLGLTDFVIRINSRPILSAILQSSNVPARLSRTVLQSLDKLDKRPTDAVKAELAKKGLSIAVINQLFLSIKNAGPDSSLQNIISLAKKFGVTQIEFSPFLVRGLDYYTGAIFETVVNQAAIGSVTGGGRYDQLIKSRGTRSTGSWFLNRYGTPLRCFFQTKSQP